MNRTMPWIVGTAIVVAGGIVVWISQRPDAGGGSLIAPPDAAAQVITPGETVRRKSEPQRKTALATSSAASTDDESWQVVVLDDQRIGWSRVTQTTATRDGRPVIRVATELAMQFRRFGQKIDIRKSLVTDETPEGDFLGYSLELTNPPAAPNVTTGVVTGRELRIESTVNGKTQTSRLPWDPEVQGPAAQDRLLKNPPLKPGDRREFKAFVPDLQKVGTVKVSVDGKQMVKLLDGRQHHLLKVRMLNSLAPEMNSRAFLDDEGKTLRSEEDLLGKTMVTFTVSEAEALRKISGADLDLAISTLAPTNAIRDPQQSSRINYRITMKSDDPAKYFPDGGNQAVRVIDRNTIELTVTAPARPSAKKSAAPPEEYLRSTPYLQADDSVVQEHARKAASGADDDPVKAALQMERYVHKTLTQKNFSTSLASAAEVAASLEGDCTEHAVLLAGMLRSHGIPSRVVIGLVYVKGVQAFGAHMWTEAWLHGSWYPLDAMMGQGGIHAAHLKIADLSLNDSTPASSFLPLLKILGQVRITSLPPR